MKNIVSAGIVVVRKENNNYKFLMLRSGNYWDFPKGRSDSGENLIDTALRETEEEASISENELKFNWGKIHRRTEAYKKGTKVAVYFVAETNKKKIVLPVSEELGRPEHDEYKWLTYNEAKKIVIERIEKILDWANEIINK